MFRISVWMPFSLGKRTAALPLTRLWHIWKSHIVGLVKYIAGELIQWRHVRTPRLMTWKTKISHMQGHLWNIIMLGDIAPPRLYSAHLCIVVNTGKEYRVSQNSYLKARRKVRSGSEYIYEGRKRIKHLEKLFLVCKEYTWQSALGGRELARH